MTSREDAAVSIDTAIVRSILYASVFEYPLTLAQLRHALLEHAAGETDILAAYASSARLRQAVEYRDGFFFPRGRRDLVAIRRRREAHSRLFLARHRRLLTLVCALPFVRLVALSGSVAHLNLDGDGDLDIFLITRGRRVWSVTVAVLLLAKLLGQRRTLCANFVLADSRLSVDQRDLFTANQIVHLKPVVGREVYAAFLDANAFVFRFYPNARHGDPAPVRFDFAFSFDRLKTALEAILWLPSLVVEPLCRAAYTWHLHRRAAAWQSPEQVRLEADCLKLHTQSHRRSILRRFDHTLRQTMTGDEAPAVAAPPLARAAGSRTRGHL